MKTLTELEKETWDAYEYALSQVPDGQMYDRVSLHKVFPDLQAAFEKCQAIETYHRLMYIK